MRAKSVIPLLLFLLASAVSAEEEAVTPTRSAHLTVELHLYATVEDAGEACRNPNWGGCRYNRGGVQVIHAAEPKDWCDWWRISIIGHEVMHAAGWNHPSGSQDPGEDNINELRDDDHVCEVILRD